MSSTDSGYGTDRQLVDGIIYLASLASDVTAIDSMMDTLRFITSRWQPTTALSSDDRLALEQLAEQLKQYLITGDPLREFTPDTLETRLREHLQPQSGWRFDLKFSLVASAGVASLTMLLPSSPSLWLRALLAVPVFLTLCAFCNAWFYLSALKNFKKEVKQAFGLLCVGIIGIGLQFAHFALIPVLGQEQLPLYRHGGFTTIDALAFLFMYLGVRRYAQALGILSPLMSLAKVGGFSLLVALATAGAAYLSPSPDKLFLGYTLTTSLLIGFFALCSAIVAGPIVRRVTVNYARSMKRLRIFNIGVVFASIGYTTITAIAGDLYGVGIGAALAICGIPPSILLLYSGYSFKKETGQ